MKTINLLLSRNLAIAVAATVLVAGASLSHAQVYKYVDENGKVYFSDKPPQDAKKQEVVDIKANTQPSSSPGGLPKVAKLDPIGNSDDRESKTILLEHMKMGYTGDKQNVGKRSKFTRESSRRARQLISKNKAPSVRMSCDRERDLSLRNAKSRLNQSILLKTFDKTFEDHGYKVADQKTFALEQADVGDLSLGAVVRDLKIMTCYDDENNAASLAQTSTYLKIEWTVFDNLARQVVYETTTEGADYGYRKPARRDGEVESASLAFRQAIENLLSHQEFVDILTAESALQAAYSDDSISLDDMKITRGNPKAKFVSKTPLIEKASVTVRTAGGHGSGFVISNPGYVLTNHHVVGQHREVIVIIGDEEQRASVIRSHPGRDVALLKLEKNFNSRPLQINASQVNLGEEIYVVGTPLDERLSFSISRGIISARRTLDERAYYQTDAAVNPGNSGGPVFNGAGNVIGITVAGLFTSDGGSKNINYVIPIMDALEALEIQPN